MYKIASYVFLATTLIVSGLYYFDISNNPCCTDPAIVSIPSNDFTQPSLHWEVIIRSLTVAGIVDNTTIYANPTNSFSMKKYDALTINLVARDEESGISKISYSGYGFCVPSTPTAHPGVAVFAPYNFWDDMPIIPKLTSCGFIEWKIGQKVSVDFGCETQLEHIFHPEYHAPSPSYRTISIDGVAENFKGGKSSINLSIQVTN